MLLCLLKYKVVKIGVKTAVIVVIKAAIATVIKTAIATVVEKVIKLKLMLMF